MPLGCRNIIISNLNGVSFSIKITLSDSVGSLLFVLLRLRWSSVLARVKRVVWPFTLVSFVLKYSITINCKSPINCLFLIYSTIALSHKQSLTCLLVALYVTPRDCSAAAFLPACLSYVDTAARQGCSHRCIFAQMHLRVSEGFAAL